MSPRRLILFSFVLLLLLLESGCTKNAGQPRAEDNSADKKRIQELEAELAKAKSASNEDTESEIKWVRKVGESYLKAAAKSYSYVGHNAEEWVSRSFRRAAGGDWYNYSGWEIKALEMGPKKDDAIVQGLLQEPKKVEIVSRSSPKDPFAVERKVTPIAGTVAFAMRLQKIRELDPESKKETDLGWRVVGIQFESKTP